MIGASTPDNLWALVLAGGDGTRLRELTRRIAGTPIPKQYCRLLGDRSLLEATLTRVRSFAPRERTAVIVNRNHIDVGWQQVQTLPAENVLIQPRNRDTGPGLLFSLLHLARRDPYGTVAVFPSDHYIGNETVFMDSVRAAGGLVTRWPEKIVVLGIRPEQPDPGFGYIMPDDPLCDEAVGPSAFHVRSFQEKPGPEMARILISRGGLWNSFVMVFQVARMLDLVSRVKPVEIERMRGVFSDPIASARAYTTLVPWNFSNQLLACIPEHLVVLRVDGVSWSDWGTPEAIRRTVLASQLPAPWLVHRSEPSASFGSEIWKGPANRSWRR
jgi:mannose-1-phosphate guanylyltransferase